MAKSRPVDRWYHWFIPSLFRKLEHEEVKPVEKKARVFRKRYINYLNKFNKHMKCFLCGGKCFNMGVESLQTANGITIIPVLIIKCKKCHSLSLVSKRAIDLEKEWDK